MGRADAETEISDVKNWLIGKDPDAGKDWRQEEKGTTEDEMVGWHHWVNGLEFEQALGVGDGQGSLVCCSPWGRKESDTTERLNWNWKKSEGQRTFRRNPEPHAFCQLHWVALPMCLFLISNWARLSNSDPSSLYPWCLLESHVPAWLKTVFADLLWGLNPHLSALQGSTDHVWSPSFFLILLDLS